MNTNTGEILSSKDYEKLLNEFPEKAKSFTPMDIYPTEKQMNRNPPKVGRNELCPCGSGKKFKKCHLGVKNAD